MTPHNVLVGVVLVSAVLCYGVLSLDRRMSGQGVAGVPSAAPKRPSEEQARLVSGCAHDENCRCEVVGPCQHCEPFELKQHMANPGFDYCDSTGRKEALSCIVNNETVFAFQSCRTIDGEEESKFAFFEGSMIALAVLSFIGVRLRNRQLDRLFQRQLRAQIDDI